MSSDAPSTDVHIPSHKPLTEERNDNNYLRALSNAVAISLKLDAEQEEAFWYNLIDTIQDIMQYVAEDEQDQFVPLISTSGPDDSDLPAIQDEGQEYQSYSELGQLFQLAAEKRRRYGCSAKEADEHPLHCFDQLDWLFAWIREWDDSFDAQCGPRSLQLWSWWPDAT